MSRRRDTRARHGAFLAVAVLFLLGTSGTALTAGLTGVPVVSADRYIGSAPSFTASAPTYDDTSGSTIVTFTLTPAAGQARARVVAAKTPTPPYETCSSGNGTTWTCPIPGLTASEAAAGDFQWTATP